MNALVKKKKNLTEEVIKEIYKFSAGKGGVALGAQRAGPGWTTD